MAVIWIFVVMGCVLAEVLTNAYGAVFVGLAALVGFVLALLGESQLIQIGVVVLLSGAGILLVRPLALADLRRGALAPGRARHARSARPVPVEAAPVPHERYGVVEELVGDRSRPGRVFLDGRSWPAVTDWPRDLPGGTPVVVRAAARGTLLVEPY